MSTVQARCALHYLAESEIFLFREFSLEGSHKHHNIVLIHLQDAVDNLIHRTGPEIQYRAHCSEVFPECSKKYCLRLIFRGRSSKLAVQHLESDDKLRNRFMLLLISRVELADQFFLF